MTIFDTWYSANVEAKLPSDVPPAVRKIAKQQAAEVWNAALSAVEKSSALVDKEGDPSCWINCRVLSELRVTS